MKKIILLFTLVLSCATVFAQNPNKNEVKLIQSFLSQKQQKVEHAEPWNVNPNAPATWTGVTWTGGRITAIEWKDKDLAGNLNLSGLQNLQTVDVSRNKLASINANGCANLTELNASRNNLVELI